MRGMEVQGPGRLFIPSLKLTSLYLTLFMRTAHPMDYT